MNANDLYKSFDAIDDDTLLKSESRKKGGMSAARWISLAAAALILGIGVFAIAHFAKQPDDNHYVLVPTPEPTQQVSPAPFETVRPTQDITETVPPTDPAVVTVHFSSERAALLSATHAMIRGESVEDIPLTPNGSGVYFGLDGGALVAYAEAELIEEPGNVRYELSSPVASFPYELGLRARKSVSDYIRRNLDPGFAGDDKLQLFGFMGENYIIFTGEPFHGYQAAAIFYTPDGSQWSEFRSFEGHPVELTGGAVLSESVAYLCYFDRSLMRFDDYTPRRLTVYKTCDGGETWEDIGLTIPDEFEGIIAPPAAALSPYFEGDHGIIPVMYSTFNSFTAGFDSHTAYFETNNGGESWVFRLPTVVSPA